MVQGPACSYIQKFFTDTCHQSYHHYQTFKSLYKVLLSAVGILLLPYHQSVHIILLSITISSFSNMSSFQHPGCLSLTQKSKIQKHLPCCSFCSYEIKDTKTSSMLIILHCCSSVWSTLEHCLSSHQLSRCDHHQVVLHGIAVCSMSTCNLLHIPKHLCTSTFIYIIMMSEQVT